MPVAVSYTIGAGRGETRRKAMNVRKARIVVLAAIALLWLLAFGQMAMAASPAVTVIVHVAIEPTVSSLVATSVTSTTALLRGNIDDDGNTACSTRGFRWGLQSGNYTYSWNETGAFHEGLFTHTINSLPLGTQIYWIAFAANPVGTGNSSERSFWTLSLPLAPTDLTATKIGTAVDSYNLTWVMGVGANWTIIRGSESRYPTSITDGYTVYNGTGTHVVVTGIDTSSTTYYYSAWSGNDHGLSLDYATTRIQGGVSGAFVALMLLPLGLTATMFITKNMMLGFPSAIFWGVLGGYAYLQSVETWDWRYLLFFACIGMVIFCMLAAYTLRKKDLSEPDVDKGTQYIDEERRRVARLDDLWGEADEW